MIKLNSTVTVNDSDSSYNGLTGEVLRISTDGETILVYLPIKQKLSVGGTWCFTPDQLEG